MTANPKETLRRLKTDKDEAIRRLAAKELYKRSCPEFISQAVKIEDKDTLGVVVPFALWLAQRFVLDVFLNLRLVIILKARQLGLTWLALAYVAWKMLFNPGFSVSALSRTENEAEELSRRLGFIFRHLPDWLCIEGKKRHPYLPVYDPLMKSLDLIHPTGEPATFMSFTSSPNAGRSFTSSLVLLDEWAFQQYAEEIWTAAYPTVNRPTGGQVIGLSTGRIGTLFEEIWTAAVKEENGFHPIFLPWSVDPRRTKEWREKTKKALPNTYRAEYPETPEEAFTVGEGAFFPEWDPDLHLIPTPGWYPPAYCQIYGAYDAGYGSRACFKWYAVFPDGKAVGYREYYPRHTTDPDQAKAILELSKNPAGEQEYLVDILADPSCWNKQSGTGESTGEIFANHGLYMRKADNDLSNGWRRLHQWLSPIPDKQGGKIPSLRFSYACANTIRTYPACMSKKTNPEDISDQSEHHCQDVDRYFCMSRPALRDIAEFIFPGGLPGEGERKWDFDDEEGLDEYEDENVSDEPGFY